MVRRITALTLILAAACKQGGIRVPELAPKGNVLNYSQYHSLEQGMTARAIRNSFGEPYHTLEQDGQVRGLTYWCEDSTGKTRQLRMVLDEKGRLQEWALVTPDGAKKTS